MKRGVHRSFRVEADQTEATRPCTLEPLVHQPPPETGPLAGRTHPHALDLADTRFERTQPDRTDDLSRGVLHDQQHAGRAVVLALPVDDVVIESGFVQRLPDMSQVRTQLTSHRLTVARFDLTDGVRVGSSHGLVVQMEVPTLSLPGTPLEAALPEIFRLAEVLADPSRQHEQQVAQAIHVLERPRAHGLRT